MASDSIGTGVHLTGMQLFLVHVPTSAVSIESPKYGIFRSTRIASIDCSNRGFSVVSPVSSPRTEVLAQNSVLIIMEQRSSSSHRGAATCCTSPLTCYGDKQ